MALLDRRRRYRKSAVQAAPALDWLKFTARTAGTFTLTIPADLGTSYITSISYSTNNGVSWTTVNNTSSQVVITTPTIPAGSSVLWKGIATRFSAYVSSWNYTIFSSTAQFDASGNIMSLLYGDNFDGKLTVPVNAFMAMFMNNSNIVNAKDLTLPATTLAKQCYNQMFSGCTSLTTMPSLPATTLAEYCYQNMFHGCTALTSTVTLNAQTMQKSCYDAMFRNCTSLTRATIYAVTLADRCFQMMFYGCSNFNYVNVRTVTTVIDGTNYLKQTYLQLWLYNVKSTGTLYAPRVWRVDLMRGSDNGYPKGWTVRTY